MFSIKVAAIFLTSQKNLQSYCCSISRDVKWSEKNLVDWKLSGVNANSLMYPIVSYTECLGNFNNTRWFLGMPYLAQTKPNTYSLSSNLNF